MAKQDGFLGDSLAAGVANVGKGLDELIKKQKKAKAEQNKPNTYQQPIPGSGTKQDGSFSQLLYATLVLIGKWDADAVLIERLPLDLYDRLSSLAEGFEQDNELSKELLTEFFKSIVGEAEGGTGEGSSMDTDADISGIDGTIPEVVWRVGIKMGAPDKALLAAMITGYVETGWTNPKTASADGYGSFGWRQERASLYGGANNTQNVAASAKRFFNEVAVFMKGNTMAKGAPSQGKYQPSWHAGKVAQAVQGSAASVAHKYEDENSEWNKKGKALFKKMMKDNPRNGAVSGVSGSVDADGGEADADETKTGSNTDTNKAKSKALTASQQSTYEKLMKDTNVYGAMPGLKAVRNYASTILPAGQNYTGKDNHSKNGGDHPKGYALDCAMGTESPTPELDRLNDFFKNKLSGMIKQLIWRNKDQFQGFDVPDHMNHVHIALKPEYAASQEKVAKAIVKAMAGESLGDSGDSATADESGNAQGEGSGNEAGAFALAAQLNLPGTMNYTEANLLGGERALMNDVPLLPFIAQLCESSMRSFQSLPDGKFHAFYPDYFGETYHRPAYWNIEDIEILDGKITLSDEALVTHMYVIGGSGPSEQDSFFNKLNTWGVVTIYNAFLSGSILTAPDTTTPEGKKKAAKEAAAAKKKNKGPVKPEVAAQAAAAEALAGPQGLFGQGMMANKIEAGRFLQRYGPRVEVVDNAFIWNRYFELFSAYQKFLLGWSRQFVTDFTFTFMPELYPGGKVAFPNHGIQMYIEEVTHEFDYEGGFTTSANLSAPSVIDTGDKIPDQTNEDLPPNMAKAMVFPIADPEAKKK